MSRGLLARLRSWRSAPKESSSDPEDTIAAVSSGDERSEGKPDASGSAEIPTASTNGAVEEVAPASEPSAEIPPIAAEDPIPVPARPLPPFRPSTETEELLAETEAPPLTLTLSEAIQLVHDSGGDAMELRFLRRELQRRGREGSEPPDLWPRVEQAVTGRLRRVGRLAEGQPLTLLRDPKVASTAGSSPGS